MTVIQTEKAPEYENSDRRQEVLDATMGWSAHEVRRVTRESLSGNESRNAAASGQTAQSRRAPSRRGGRGYTQPTDRDIELARGMEYEPTDAERARIAGPGDPGWEEAHEIVGNIAEQAVVKRAIDAGQGHILSAIQRARAEKRARINSPSQN